MDRRGFLRNSALSALAARFNAAVGEGTGRQYRVLGVPLRSGSFYPGNEDDAQAYREVHFLERLRAAGVPVTDEGNVAIPSYLPHHAVPPIRSWPGPRIAWECVRDRVAPYLRAGDVPLLIGCDCSVVVGTAEAMMQVSGADKVHVLYVDGDFDDAAPEAAKTNSAASVGVWLLTHASPFWSGPPLKSSQVTVMGWSVPSHAGGEAVHSISREQMQRVGPRAAAEEVLRQIPSDAALLVHFDIDVMKADEMPTAYFPHAQGLSLRETTELMATLLNDNRVRLIEISEYAALRDGSKREIDRLVELMAIALKR
jgi:arginase